MACEPVPSDNPFDRESADLIDFELNVLAISHRERVCRGIGAQFMENDLVSVLVVRWAILREIECRRGLDEDTVSGHNVSSPQIIELFVHQFFERNQSDHGFEGIKRGGDPKSDVQVESAQER